MHQHVRHDDGCQRAYRRVAQGHLDAMIEPRTATGEQARGARDEGREREPDDHDGKRDAFDGRIHAASASGLRHASASEAATMPAIAATNRPSRYGSGCASSATTPAVSAPTNAGRAFSAGPTSATSARV